MLNLISIGSLGNNGILSCIYQTTMFDIRQRYQPMILAIEEFDSSKFFYKFKHKALEVTYQTNLYHHISMQVQVVHNFVWTLIL